MLLINRLLLLFVVFAIISSCGESKNNGETASSYTHEFDVVDSPMGKVLTYTLENGLKVYMKIDRAQPRINTNIAVKVGSKNDPKDYTGLAHYLEHMLFKGTSKLGSINWEKEKVLLDSIANLYEAHYATKDLAERKAIYKQIDAVSGEAANFAVANEYDKLLASMGAKGTNAYTSNERTVYINDIPTNELERWLKVEGERFSELVLRLFHTELEAVYEEYNISRDRDQELAYELLMDKIFPNHQYGQQTTIGEGEHLKAPSLKQIQAFFDTYYVPNNMAMILAGDLNPDETIDLIEKYFGGLEKKEIPTFEVIKETPISAPIITEITGKEYEWVSVGFRLDPQSQKEEDIIGLLSEVFSNGKSGILDLNLLKEQQVESAYAYGDLMKDYGSFYMEAIPKPGQSLEEARGLLLAQLDSLKEGKFADWMLAAVVKNYKKRQLEASEYVNYWTYNLSNIFIQEKDVKEELNSLDKLSKLTKQDIIDFANATFKENHVTVYKRTGESSIPKVEKPEITQVALNRDTASLFFNEVNKMEASRMSPVFSNYDDLKFERLKNKDVEYVYVENEIKDLFSLEYIVEIGEDHNLMLPHAVNYAQYLGTDSLSSKELEQAFYKMGVEFYVYAGSDQSYLGITGLKESFEPALALFEHYLANLKPDQTVYNNYVQQEFKLRDDNKLNKNQINYGATAYAKYGPMNLFNNIIPRDELASQDIIELVQLVKDFSSYKHIVYFNGSDEDNTIKNIIEQYHVVPAEVKSLPKPIAYTELPIDNNKVYFVQYDMVQAFLTMQAKGGAYDETLLAPTNVFNTYFGSGLSSIVFQEIRESKALAYSAYSYYSTPYELDKHHYVGAFVGTQSDKLTAAAPAMQELLDNMPTVDKQIKESIDGTLKKIETSRSKKSNLIYSYLSARKMNRTKSVNEIIYQDIKEMTPADLVKFYEANIKGKQYNYIILGDKNKLDMEFIKSLGEFKELTLEEIFGE